MSATIRPAMPEAEYHAHPALSASGAKRLIQTCPAIFKHERDNGRPDKDEFDVGHAAHALVLGVGEPLAIRPESMTSWQTKASKEFKAKARAEGAVPITPEQHAEVLGMVHAVRTHPLAGRLFADGTPEQSVIWHDERWDVERRARFDWLTAINGRPVIVDLKTSTTADPKPFGRKAYDFGYDIQDTFYRDAAQAIGHDDPAFLFVVVEKQPPHVVTVVELDTEAKRIGRARTDRALEIFRDCTRADVWPGYSQDVELVSLPRYATYDLEDVS